MEFITQEPVPEEPEPEEPEPPPYLTATVIRSMKKEIKKKGLFFRLRHFSAVRPELVFKITEFTEDLFNNRVEIKATTVVEKPKDAENIILDFSLSRKEYTWRTDLLTEAQRLTITREPPRPVKEGGSKKRTKKRKTKKRKTRKRKTKRKNHK